jgi:histidinol dehydrogenase
MAIRLDTQSPDFSQTFDALLSSKRELSVDVSAIVSAIIEQVRAEGDEAVLALTRQFDWPIESMAQARVSAEEIKAASQALAPDTITAFEHAARRIADYHRRQLPEDVRWVDDDGVELGWRWGPLDSVGLYVPGGTASLSSSVLMNAIPAKVAGVGRLVMVTPTPAGRLDPATLVAAQIAGVDEIWRIGGAQAIAALAFGTQSIAPVDKIVGPGNAYVAAAKRLVFGTVGIDMIAGPSEILIVADRANDPSWIAADLLSQAEHDTSSQSILITDDSDFADRVAAAVDRHLETLSRADIARRSWAEHGAIILVPDLDQAPSLVNRVAPEHLELAVENPDPLVARIRHAGAIFLGRYSPEALGDYIAGANHVLPTARASRYASGLSSLDFVKRSSIMRCSARGMAAIGPDGARMADAEALPAHALSVRLRLAGTT